MHFCHSPQTMIPHSSVPPPGGVVGTGLPQVPGPQLSVPGAVATGCGAALGARSPGLLGSAVGTSGATGGFVVVVGVAEAEVLVTELEAGAAEPDFSDVHAVTASTAAIRANSRPGIARNRGPFRIIHLFLPPHGGTTEPNQIASAPYHSAGPPNRYRGVHDSIGQGVAMVGSGGVQRRVRDAAEEMPKAGLSSSGMA
ncbi:hypothetical protein GCM10027088_42860 [Nocardia goodfellowii]